MYEQEPEPVYIELGKLETFEEAREWVKENSGRAITRSSDGEGFLMKIEVH